MKATIGQQKVRIPPLEPGVYHAVCAMVVDLGFQYTPAYKRTARKVRILWEVVGETVTIGEEERPRLISKDYTLSLDERSNLFKHLQSWRGKTFTDEELEDGFDLSKLCDANCQLLLIHKSGDRGPYAVVDSVIPLKKGMPRHKAEKTFYFDMEDPATHAVFEELPRYIQEAISKAENFDDTGLQLPERSFNNAGDPPPEGCFGSGYTQITSGDDLPF